MLKMAFHQPSLEQGKSMKILKILETTYFYEWMVVLSTCYSGVVVACMGRALPTPAFHAQ